MASKTKTTDLINEGVEEAVQTASPAPVVVEKIVEKPVTVVVNSDPYADKRRRDNERVNQLNREFKRKLETGGKMSYTPPRFYAERLNKVYTYGLNSELVVVRFDGTKQTFPIEVGNHLIRKLARILDSTSYKEYNDNLT